MQYAWCFHQRHTATYSNANVRSFVNHVHGLRYVRVCRVGRVPRSRYRVHRLCSCAPEPYLLLLLLLLLLFAHRHPPHQRAHRIDSWVGTLHVSKMSRVEYESLREQNRTEQVGNMIHMLMLMLMLILMLNHAHACLPACLPAKSRVSPACLKLAHSPPPLPPPHTIHT